MEQSVNAMVYGKTVQAIPEDLFIPIDALEVFLESFSGPLDLLLYLIRKKNIDILDIPITLITEQYLEYIAFLFKTPLPKFELAAEYLLMAGFLAEIKSRLLLPPKASPFEEPEEDPRMALVKQLQAYEAMKKAAYLLDELPRLERDHFLVQIEHDVPSIKMQPEVDLASLLLAMKDLLKKTDHLRQHEISRETLSVRDRMSLILRQLQEQDSLEFTQLFSIEEGRAGIVVSFLAILELARLELVSIIQAQDFSKIYIRTTGHG